MYLKYKRETIEGVLKTLDQLQVSGIGNCTIIANVSNTLSNSWIPAPAEESDDTESATEKPINDENE